MSKIKKKLENHEYTCSQECIDDFRLIFNNCITYNKPGEVSFRLILRAVVGKLSDFYFRVFIEVERK